MTNQVSEVAPWAGPVVACQVRDAPGDVEVPDVLHRHHEGPGAALRGAEGRILPDWDLHRLVLHLREPRQDHLLQGVQGLPAQHGQAHDVAAVPGGVELQQALPHTHPRLLRTDVQRLLVASTELGEVVTRVCDGFLYLINPPGVVGNVLLVLRVDSVHLSVCGGLRE